MIYPVGQRGALIAENEGMVCIFLYNSPREAQLRVPDKRMVNYTSSNCRGLLFIARYSDGISVSVVEYSVVPYSVVPYSVGPAREYGSIQILCFFSRRFSRWALVDRAKRKMCRMLNPWRRDQQRVPCRPWGRVSTTYAVNVQMPPRTSSESIRNSNSTVQAHPSQKKKHAQAISMRAATRSRTILTLSFGMHLTQSRMQSTRFQTEIMATCKPRSMR